MSVVLPVVPLPAGEVRFFVVNVISTNNLEYNLTQDDSRPPLKLGVDETQLSIYGRWFSFAVKGENCIQEGEVDQITGTGCGYLNLGPNNWDTTGALLSVYDTHISYRSDDVGTQYFFIEGLIYDRRG